MKWPESITVCEVGPRDGLQNEETQLSVDQKVALIVGAVDSGIRVIEVGSFVHPTAVPQLAETGDVVRKLRRVDGVEYRALVANLKGVERAFDAGLVLVGTLGYMACLNEVGAIAVASRTLDVDLARRQQLRLGVLRPFLDTMHATGLPFVAVPGFPSSAPSTSVKLPGVQGLRVDVLAPGSVLGAAVSVPELQWTAQAVPFYDYLLDETEPGAMLAGNQCIPIRLPQAARFVWHKLYSSTQRSGFPEKAAKDQQQALVLGAVLAETDPVALRDAGKEAPAAMLDPVRPFFDTLLRRVGGHPELSDVLRECLGGDRS